MLDKFFKLCDSLGFKQDVYKNFEETEFHRAKYGGNGIRLIFNTARNEVRVSKDFFTNKFGYTVKSAGFSLYNIEKLKECIEDIQTISITNDKSF